MCCALCTLHMFIYHFLQHRLRGAEYACVLSLKTCAVGDLGTLKRCSFIHAVTMLTHCAPMLAYEPTSLTTAAVVGGVIRYVATTGVFQVVLNHIVADLACGQSGCMAFACSSCPVALMLHQANHHRQQSLFPAKLCLCWLTFRPNIVRAAEHLLYAHAESNVWACSVKF